MYKKYGSALLGPQKCGSMGSQEGQVRQGGENGGKRVIEFVVSEIEIGEGLETRQFVGLRSEEKRKFCD